MSISKIIALKEVLLNFFYWTKISEKYEKEWSKSNRYGLTTMMALPMLYAEVHFLIFSVISLLDLSNGTVQRATFFFWCSAVKRMNHHCISNSIVFNLEKWLKICEVCLSKYLFNFHFQTFSLLFFLLFHLPCLPTSFFIFGSSAWNQSPLYRFYLSYFLFDGQIRRCVLCT